MAQVERAVQRLELYDRGVVFQRKIDDALAECSVQLEERIEDRAALVEQRLAETNKKSQETQAMLTATNRALEDANMGSEESMKRLAALREEMLERHEETISTHRKAQEALPEEVVDGDMLRDTIESGKQFTAQAEERMTPSLTHIPQ